MKPYKLILSIIAVLILLLFTGCELPPNEEDADQVMQQQTESAMVEANRQVGMPAIVNYQEKKQMKMLYEIRDQENLVLHAYIADKYHGKVGQYLGRCLGYGIPYSTQFSNPQRLVDVTDYGIGSYQANDAAVIPQPEPNGLFMPEGLAATWLMLLDSAGEAHPVYIEPEIIVSPIKLHK